MATGAPDVQRIADEKERGRNGTKERERTSPAAGRRADTRGRRARLGGARFNTFASRSREFALTSDRQIKLNDTRVSLRDAAPPRRTHAASAAGRPTTSPLASVVADAASSRDAADRAAMCVCVRVTDDSRIS